MPELVGSSSVLRKVMTSPVGPDETPTRFHPERGEAEAMDSALRLILDQFRLISQIDDLWDEGVAAGRIRYDAADEEEIGRYYREWLDAAEKLAVELRAHEAAHATPPRDRDEFLDRLGAARGICTPDEVFFSGPAFRALEQSAIDAFHAGETVEFEEMGD